MKRVNGDRGIFKKILILGLSVCLVTLPAMPTMATESKDSIAEKGATAKSEPVVLSAQKKIVVSGSAATNKKTGSTAAEPKVTKTKNTAALSAQKGDGEGLSTWQWVGIGAGTAVAVVGVAALLGGSSSSDSSPTYPSEANIVGSWRGQGTCLVDSRTYDGTYTFYAGGSHIYGVNVSDGAHHRGRGTWALTAGSYAFEVRNDTGSVYQGNFAEGNLSTVTLYTTNGRWKVTLTKR